jgi:hypothetical protein
MEFYMCGDINQYGPALSRAFSPACIESLMDFGQSSYLSELLDSSKLMQDVKLDGTVGEFFESLYACLGKAYRGEYVYKNAIANKILLGRHSLNSAHMLTEFRVANCKADVVILNGTSTVYEIKSKYDSLDRLNNQVAAYSEIFDRINVITAPVHLEKASRILPGNVGIMLLTPKYTIKEIRGAASGKANVNPRVIFDSLRAKEYKAIIHRVFGAIPDVPNTQIYRECRELFCTLTPQRAHDEMVIELSHRDKSAAFKEHVRSAPQSLKAYALSSSRVNRKSAKRFNKMLTSSASSMLSVAT